ncbi:MAG TPA: hypothetical protein DEF63_06765, partial [Cyanobacteria bacterium UBA11440]|nr:hypothetical protein [Cyanobacteria bacterium UBA11440]
MDSLSQINFHERGLPVKKHAFIALLLLTLVLLFNISSTFAAETNSSGTLSNIKTISKTILSSNTSVYTLTEVTSDTTVPENAVTVSIDGKTYYYVPNTTGSLTQKDYQRLASTGHVALKELTSSNGAIYKVGDKYYGYDANKLPESAYTLTPTTTTGNGVITKYEYDKTTNTLTPKYYELNLRKTEYGTGGKSQTITINVLGKDIDITVKYDDSTTKTYTNVYTSAINNTSTITIEDAIFENITSSSALVGNKGTITNLTSDFISNSVTVNSKLSGGGLIGNYSYSSSSSIGDITGDFISNEVTASSVDGGGLIGNFTGSSYSVSSTIGDITGGFISNTVTLNSEVRGGGLIGNEYSSSTIGDITGYFISNEVTASSVYGGGLIGNYSISSSSSHIIGDITGGFISNNVTVNSSVYGGGLISNYVWVRSYISTSTIGDITGDFISNTVTIDKYYLYGGGLIGNYVYNYTSSSSSTSTIGDITGDFISNAVTIKNPVDGGGLIGNFASDHKSSVFSSSIGGIIGDFISNEVTASSVYGGGLIGNHSFNYSSYSTSTSISTSTIGDITGDFISNAVTIKNPVYGGGLIGNYSSSSTSTIGDINSNFYNNILKLTGTSSQTVMSGVIGNYAYGNNTKATIKSISGAFENNSVIKESGSATVYAGVIYNNDIITNGIINSTFRNNYVKLAEGTVYASVIYTTKDLSINADNGTTLFSGNYSQIGDGEKNYNAVYVGSNSAMLTLKATNNGVITFENNNNITGASGYTLNITGDNTSTVNFHNQINNAKLNVTDVGKVDFVDNTARTYNLVSMNSAENVKYSIDIDLANGTSDKFITTGVSTGILTINDINILGSSDTNKVFQILNLASGSTLQLSLSDSIQRGFINELNSNTVKNTDVFNQSAGWALVTTNTTNDSIAYVTNTVVFDTLVLINKKVTTEERNFNFVDTSTYTLTDDLGITSAGTFNINGMKQSSLARRAISRASTSSTMSTIDLAGKRGFTIESGTTFNITDTAIINGVAPDKGGAIYNNGGTIGTLSGKFVGNYAYNKTAAVQGGAIYTKGGVTSSITGAFEDNYALSDENTARAGALRVASDTEVTKVDATFSGNYAQGTMTSAGAIFNAGTIGSVSGTMSGNYSHSTTGPVQGGAIYNSGTITSITSDFTNNYALADAEAGYGGAIYNSGTITTINGSYTGNYTKSTVTRGGVIFNEGIIDTISGTFDSNNAVSTNGNLLGGIIANYNTINNVGGTFTNNTVSSTGGIIYGGLIYNGTDKIMDKINATVNNNNISSTVGLVGGIIQNQSTIDTIDGSYDDNVISAVEVVQGGIINISKSVTNIKGAYKNNKITAKKVSGGIISNTGNIDNIKATFENNTSESTGGNAFGGVIMNYTGKTIGTINSTFKKNSLKASGNAIGGVIQNQGTITKIEGLFEGNYVKTFGSAICNAVATANIGSINADFIGNYGGTSVIYNYGTIGDIIGDFTGNYSTIKSAGGSCITSFNGFVGNITGNFTENYQDFSSDADSGTWGGILYFRAGDTSGVENPTETTIYTIGKISGEFTGNYSLAGTINGSGLHFRAVNSTVFQTVAEGVDGTFTGNYGVASKGSAKGGVLYNEAFSTYSTVKTVTGTYKN